MLKTQAIFATLPSSIQYISAGKLKPLAVTSSTRLQALPNIPAMADSLPGYDVTSWFGIGGPRGTSREIVGTLNKEINEALAEPGMTTRFAELGGIALPGSPGDFGKLIADETGKWARVIRAANIKPE